MSNNQVVEVEGEDVFENHKALMIVKVKEFLTETYAQDREDFVEDLKEALDVETLPNVTVEVVLHIGKRAISTSGFTVEEKEEPEDDEDE